jgi:hypothetical protein
MGYAENKFQRFVHGGQKMDLVTHVQKFIIFLGTLEVSTIVIHNVNQKADIGPG